MVSGIPTQLVVVAIMMVGFRVNPFDQASLENAFSLEFMAVMLLVDTALTAVLIRVFLEMSGEDSRTVFLGKKPALGEILRGIALAPAIIIGVSVLTLSLRQVAPWLHTVKESPYVKYMDTPLDAAVFLVVVVLGAAVKEELQRAFVSIVSSTTWEGAGSDCWCSAACSASCTSTRAWTSPCRSDCWVFSGVCSISSAATQ
jgi:hypothetical protein